jgi:hypothetical protein
MGMCYQKPERYTYIRDNVACFERARSYWRLAVNSGVEDHLCLQGLNDSSLKTSPYDARNEHF